MISNELIIYLNELNNKSKFIAKLSDRGGYITFSNSGQRGSIKYFTLGLDSFIEIFKDILEKHELFYSHNNYVESEWRDLGGEYFNDDAANAISTVQTKPLFTTLSKLLFWANKKDVNDFSDNNIDLEKQNVEKTIEKLESLAQQYLPKSLGEVSPKNQKSKVLFSTKDFNNFAFKSFKLLIEKYGFEKVTKDKGLKESTINEVKYQGVKLKESFGSNNLIGIFQEEQNKESLKSSGIPRYFDENLNIEEHPYSYFTTQWADTTADGLTFKSLEKFISEITKEKLKIVKNGDNYSLIEYENQNASIVQKIYYGAPGTGKSHKIETIIKDIPEDQKERVTFHPEYDYSSFVGGYRPSSETNEDGTTGDVKYKFVPQVFTKIYVEAWKNPYKDYYLAIEEINRGNCAEIFGDLFQLLDRNSNYSISPSNELREYLEKVLNNEEWGKGIADGKMKLPSNLHILASMNTSDQSLFPMDSAFKRRWSWEYIPIWYEEFNDDRTETNEPTRNLSFDYQVKIDDQSSFKWIEFIESVNKLIKGNRNLGSDKCIGNYFIKPIDGKEIKLEEFINKAVFYLWVDVFKDEEESIFSSIEEGTSYEDFFPVNTNGKEKLIKLLSENILDIKIIKPEITPIEEETE